MPFSQPLSEFWNCLNVDWFLEFSINCSTENMTPIHDAHWEEQKQAAQVNFFTQSRFQKEAFSWLSKEKACRERREGALEVCKAPNVAIGADAVV